MALGAAGSVIDKQKLLSPGKQRRTVSPITDDSATVTRGCRFNGRMCGSILPLDIINNGFNHCLNEYVEYM